MRPFLLACSFAVTSVASSVLSAQSVGESAIRGIHSRWNKNSYRTLTFVQETQFGDGRKEIWFESLKSPGLLRIDIAPSDSGARMMLFRQDSVYQGRRGRNVVGRPYVHPLMVLLTDIASADPTVTVAKVARMGFDLTKTRDDVFMGQPVTVIGAAPGDSTSSQFWIEKVRLLVVRVSEKESRPGAGISDTRVVKHARAGTGWVESEIEFYQGGKLVQRELYNEITTDVPLADSIFQPVLTNVPSWIGARRRP